jgi:hypothetical protein
MIIYYILGYFGNASRCFEMLQEVSVRSLRLQAWRCGSLSSALGGGGWNLMTWQTEWRDSMWQCWIAIGPCLHEVVSTCLNMIQHDSTWFSMMWFDVYSIHLTTTIWMQLVQNHWLFDIVWTCLNMFEQFEEDEHMKNMKQLHGIEATHWNHGGHSSQLYAFSLWGSGYIMVYMFSRVTPMSFYDSVLLRCCWK